MKGLKFFRQYGVGRYIADFYCPKMMLALEIDGGQHYTDEGISRDSVRERAFALLGIKTVRFLNIDILKSCDAVLEKIWELTPPTPSLQKRGEISSIVRTN